MTSTTIALISVLALGWLLASTIGTWAYFNSESADNTDKR